jgi:hypothetical protein
LDHVRGHPECPANLDDLVLPRLKKLGRLGGSAWVRGKIEEAE